MRPFLILVWLIATVLTFYSALGFKSHAIEDDIRTRVTDDLSSNNLNAAAIDVDGRHVTLSGLVSNAASKQSHLDTADATYGALGPIDGLNVPSDSGFVSATKSDTGIVLAGQVANETVRGELTEAAQAAFSSGTVTDNLTIGGPEVDWQANGAFGINQLGNLSSGYFKSSAAGEVLTGTANDRAAFDAIEAAGSDRENWTSFVSAPVTPAPGYLTATKSADAITLRGTVSDDATRDTLIDAANDVANGAPVVSELSIGAASGAWETSSATGLRQLGRLSQGSFTATPEGANLSGTALDDAAAAEINDNAGGIANLTALVTTPVDIAPLEAEISTLKDTVTGREATITDLRSRLTDAEARAGSVDTEKSDLVSQLTAMTAARNTAVLDTEAKLGEFSTTLAERDATIVELQSTLGTQTAQIATLQGQVDSIGNSQANLGNQNTTLATDLVAMTSERDDLQARIETTTQQLNTLRSDKDAEIAALSETNSTLEQQLNALGSDKDAEIATLSQTNSTLEQQLNALGSDKDAEIATLSETNSTLEQQLNTLRSDKDAEIAALTSDRQQEVTGLRTNLASLSGIKTKLERDLVAARAGRDELDANNQALQNQLSNANDEITALKAATPVATAPSPDFSAVIGRCNTIATQALEAGKINFNTGTAEVVDDSADLLERLSGIALACADDGVSLEIGGHTDARGDADANQQLSELRANTIRDFMVSRGVPAASLTVVGYGETQPIADNETEEGLAANRRISFDWRSQ